MHTKDPLILLNPLPSIYNKPLSPLILSSLHFDHISPITSAAMPYLSPPPHLNK